MKEKPLCDKCQKKFDEQQGELLITDMCEACKQITLLSIFEPNIRLHE